MHDVHGRTRRWRRHAAAASQWHVIVPGMSIYVEIMSMMPAILFPYLWWQAPQHPIYFRVEFGWRTIT
jgi:hypothetical protein